ncbi:EscU/YscU/HrcU family type III secretion system export apparatus switch protein [Paraburkholderia silvatlantica]|uniref:Flagellar biosynthesis protein n=1 Tax=Paraburkholderia silvatlantica TaxID=321895 RepID=A0A2U1A0G3_9BURK|nr:EscU/YscU/HrcU family type III secretion system export apparatus switch protein [Paraburkholderia silvatlantica]MBB2931864.1 flagellar biosynthesis protein [Paraburkholderia silvatlantica]PVY24869.1 flagellar biosynthesis protein [Paraburkholderia silvatlantica]PXW31981.1 flagellar biosynthesis protein [Paraburkholderia silvatlantica]PYE22770.1 flagellar biosynthesis protein [Paraburkholderia silvatlantica]TDQ89941.1 flagellar biosynthesis protein [Paraburkholderia silvatlantica]
MSRTHRKSAAALAYDAPEGDGAPRVVAKGYGLVAEMIVQRAKEAGLYVHEAPEMVSLLMRVDLDAKIPPQLYQAVAELLAWLHRLEAGDDAKANAAAQAQAQTAAPAGAAPRDISDIRRIGGTRPALPFNPSTST